ncbi:MAG: GyrI-like domain-containing protein [Propionibacteriaceae bacterium]|jgi:hypothetical protein|nr:GyrI-like domain-containing protein [Propionibacteriaceae bacterium]
MPYDVRKAEKALYQPTMTPTIIDVPAGAFLAVDGRGDPNTSPDYAAAIELLYGLAYGIKMTHKATLEYVVPPLEGFWSVADVAYQGGAIPDKTQFVWTAVIRQPDFVTAEIVEAAKPALTRKKPGLDVTRARLETITEGLCVQVLHVGPYDDELPTITAMEGYAAEQGYVSDLGGRRHHEIYLADARRTASEKLKTIIRHPVRPASA